MNLSTALARRPARYLPITAMLAMGCAFTAGAVSAETAGTEEGRPFDEVVTMLRTASFTADCYVDNVQLAPETPSAAGRSVSYRLVTPEKAATIRLNEYPSAADSARWVINRSTAGGVPYWRLSINSTGAARAPSDLTLDWIVDDSTGRTVRLAAQTSAGVAFDCDANL